jgi:hypothetical protein
LNPTNNFINTSINVIVRKNIDNAIAIIVVVGLFDMAAGQANHTPIIAKANAAIICHKLLFSAVIKFHFVIILAKYSPYIFNPKNHKFVYKKYLKIKKIELELLTRSLL